MILTWVMIIQVDAYIKIHYVVHLRFFALYVYLLVCFKSQLQTLKVPQVILRCTQELRTTAIRLPGLPEYCSPTPSFVLR